MQCMHTSGHTPVGVGSVCVCVCSIIIYYVFPHNILYWVLCMCSPLRTHEWVCSLQCDGCLGGRGGRFGQERTECGRRQPWGSVLGGGTLFGAGLEAGSGLGSRVSCCGQPCCQGQRGCPVTNNWNAIYSCGKFEKDSYAPNINIGRYAENQYKK
jgi:hypothetical protein